LCRKRIPDRVPRPPTTQEMRMAVRLAEVQESWTAEPRLCCTADRTSAPSGRYNPAVNLVYRLSDKHNISGGAVQIAVSPTGEELAVTSTSISQILFVSTSDGSLNSTVEVGGPFPQGPQGAIYSPSDPNILMVTVNGMLCSFKRTGAATWTLARMATVAEQRGYTQDHKNISMDGSGHVLLGVSEAPSSSALHSSQEKHVWLHSSLAAESTARPLSLVTPDNGTGCSSAVNDINCGCANCLWGWCADATHVCALPDGTVACLTGEEEGFMPTKLILVSPDAGVGPIDSTPAGGILDPVSCFALMCASPSGDIFIVCTPDAASFDSPPSLYFIPDPRGEDSRRPSITKLHGLRRFEETHAICASKSGVVYLIVCLNFPADREIYAVTPAN
jgi:hypothetical protein